MTRDHVPESFLAVELLLLVRGLPDAVGAGQKDRSGRADRILVGLVDLFREDAQGNLLLVYCAPRQTPVFFPCAASIPCSSTSSALCAYPSSLSLPIMGRSLEFRRGLPSHKC